MRQQLMAQNDQALRNIESMPGGYNALRRMYQTTGRDLEGAVDSMARQQLGGSGRNPWPVETTCFLLPNAPD